MSGQAGTSAPVRLEELVYAATGRLIAEMSGLTKEVYLQVAIAKMVTRDVCWGLVKSLDILPDELADDLEIMAEVLREPPSPAGAVLAAPGAAPASQAAPAPRTDLFEQPPSDEGLSGTGAQE